jgi:nicotinamide phosphoribosyltransferase
VAIKSVYAEFKNEDGTITKMPVYKDPKTDREDGGGHFKKSQKGCCSVIWKDKWTGDITYVDGMTWDESIKDTLMKPVFKDGKILKEETLSEIRNRLNMGKF